MIEKFTVFPAIDLRDGLVVRLAQGDPNRQTVYGTDPALIAAEHAAAGAAWIHVVNLDGAFGASGHKNLAALEQIIQKTPDINIQFGGGLRNLESIDKVFSTGVRRVILGTIAVEQPMLVAQAVEIYGAERIGVAIDARDGKVRTRGWLAETLHEPAGLADDMKAMGIRIIVFTDITRDGLSTGIALETTRNLAEQTGLAVIASGGAASLADVHAAYSAGLAGLIIGRALYEGHVNLSSALAVGSPDQEE